VLQIGKYEIWKAKDLSAPLHNILIHNVPLQTVKLSNMKYCTSAFGTSKHWLKKNLYYGTNMCVKIIAGAFIVIMVFVFSWKEMLEQCLVWAFLHSQAGPSDGLMCMVQAVW
jgi:hypothetical protein